MLLNLIIILLVAGAVLYLLKIIPIDATMKTVIQVLIVIAVIIYLLVEVAAPFMQSRGL